MADGVCIAVEPDGSAGESVHAVMEPANETPPTMHGLKVRAGTTGIGMPTKVRWTQIGRAWVCLRVHGEAEVYVVSGMGDAAWKPGQPVFWRLWPAPDRECGLPRWPAGALAGWGEAA